VSNIIQNWDQAQFANGQSSRDLRANSDVMEPEKTQLDVNATEQCPGVDPEEFPAPIGKLFGLKLLQAENGMAVFELVADERHANPMGTLHGGVLCDIADAAMGFAYYTTLAPDESLTTLELKINFLRPVWKRRFAPKQRWFAPAGSSGSSSAMLSTNRSGLSRVRPAPA
jgi:acyl-coenzyme A thioesterase PaaI-like protein